MFGGGLERGDPKGNGNEDLIGGGIPHGRSRVVLVREGLLASFLGGGGSGHPGAGRVEAEKQ